MKKNTNSNKNTANEQANNSFFENLVAKLDNSSASSKRGVFASITAILVIAIIIAANLAIHELPSNLREFDMSSEKLYTISDTSKEYTSKLDQDIEFIMVAQREESDERIVKFVDNYAALSNHISVTWIDPVADPQVLTDYDCAADSLVVLSSKTGKFMSIPFLGYANSMIVYEMDYLTSEISETQFDAEGQITSAIDYVVNDASGMVYTLTGHSETDLPSNLTNRMSKAHIEIVSDSLNLLNDSIPEDCDLLICYNPTLDLADVELTTLQEYLEKGRDMMLVIDQAELENFNKLLNDYGLKMQSGFVGDQSTYYQQYYNSYEYFIFAPTVSEYSDVTSKITASTITMYAKGMLECTPVRSSIDVDAFLTTSKSGLLVNGEITSKNEFILGAASTEKISENETTRFTVFSTLYFCEDDLTMSFPNMANLDVVINAVAAHFPGIEGSAVSIPSKSLSVTYNTVENYGLWSIIFVGIIPVATIVGGLFFWVKRRKK